MTYGITLLEADIKDAMHGKMRLGLEHEGARKAELAYEWDETQFTATFHGHAPTLPVPAHPVVLLSKPIDAIYALKTQQHRLPTDVFKDHLITITIP
jgi:hypothetical protein